MGFPFGVMKTSWNKREMGLNDTVNVELFTLEWLISHKKTPRCAWEAELRLGRNTGERKREKPFTPAFG